ncbi:hypothetical protein DSCA_53530 [Desulfosarcina alkanivorans]|uniref:4-vinyl reductase 4VR domain-containing protein n=1 Tax=Desulfosarcina alkanivorans TaxID=571177 RepID=A0A5K7YTP4_9BACT|nr:DUF6125 family protein [Desulfosarcina alkanivorans]BBO71423.1 hypothetical protein DSCA_53530 [Desulfosarcina alkanivorans]
MKKAKNVKQEETVDLLNKCWMTHDGMWFFHCLQEFGIEATNKINKSAIKSLSAIEIARVKKTLECMEPEKSFDTFKSFFNEASKLMIPNFMNVIFTYPDKDKMAWEFKQDKCFAYTGIKRIGVIDKYECGVLYRIKCWLDELGIKNSFIPEIDKCHMHSSGNCSGEIQLYFKNN